MKKINVLTIVGGISRESLNKKFFQSIKDLGPDKFSFTDFDISNLPFFSQDLEMDPPDIVTEFKDKIRECNALLIVTPEYNRSYPGVLKNAIDWGSRPYGQNLWDKKPAAILGASPGNIGTFGAQHHLRQVLSYLNMHVLGQPEIYFNASGAFDDKGKLVNEKTKQLLQNYFDEFYELVKLVSTKEMEAIPPRESQHLKDSSLPH